MVMDWRTARHLGAGSAESYDGTRREARLPEPPCVYSGGHSLRSTGSSDGIAGRSTRWRRAREIKLDDRVGESASKHLFDLRHIPDRLLFAFWAFPLQLSVQPPSETA